jgi:REP element-mobilizing transposase RayT
MSRPLRFIPPGGSLVEVTCRTVQGRFLLRPSRELNEIVVGLLARARRRHPVAVVAAVFLSNHFHLLLHVRDAGRLAGFMHYLNGNLAREAARLHGWSGPFWARRYRAIVVSDEEEAQVDRLRYLLAHGAKEDLVPRPRDWPGVHCVEALCTGQPLRGVWVDRTAEGRDRRAGCKVHRYTHAENEVLHLAPLPCWQHLDGATYRRRVADLLSGIEEEVRTRRRQEGKTLPSRGACRAAVRRLHPHAAPESWEPRPAPRFHAYRPERRSALRDAYRAFLTTYRRAAAQLRHASQRGTRLVVGGPSFPPGSFPPALSFVPAQHPRAP